MGDLFNTIIGPIEWLVAWIMYGFHQAFTSIGMPPASAWTWALSIVGLVIVMRAAMIPLFVKQIMASRKMQMIQPELQKIQKKYKGKSDPESRQAMTQETMELYKKEGTNPFSSCLPILVQSPFFFGLFRVLNSMDEIAAGTHEAIGPITQPVAEQFERRRSSGAAVLDVHGCPQPGDPGRHGRADHPDVGHTFTTQRQLMTKNMPASALDNPFAKQQKVLLYVLPLVFAVSGVNFPIGVLIYWFTTNVWSMCQQFYVIRRMPAPGSAAEKASTRASSARASRSPGLTPRRPRPTPRRRRRPSWPSSPGSVSSRLEEAQEEQGPPVPSRPAGASGARRHQDRRPDACDPGPPTPSRTARSRTAPRQPARRPATRPSPHDLIPLNRRNP